MKNFYRLVPKKKRGKIIWIEVSDVLNNPKVKKALVGVLERKLMEPLSPELERGWKEVQKGRKCVFPSCEKKSETAAFHGYPLCREHFDLAQWISIIIYDKVYDEEDPETLASEFKELKLLLKQK